MIDTNETVVRHTFETEILRSALRGDMQAAYKSLGYLSSANPHLCQIMQETIHDLGDAQIWQNLLRCLAYHRWIDQIDCNPRSDPNASERMDQCIIVVFTKDETEGEGPLKDGVLQKALSDPESRIRQAAAYLLGLRGDLRAVPVLAETLQNHAKEWQLRAVRALCFLKDELCGPPLLKLLITDRGDLHREAGRALRSLGDLAKSTWLEALNHPDNHIRWHAAHGLGEIGDARYAMILAEGLRDENYAVRWATADVLPRLGSRAVPAILTMITHHQLDEPLRQAAYHALRGITTQKTRQYLKPLLDALRGLTPGVEAPAVAQRLLMEWERNE